MGNNSVVVLALTFIALVVAGAGICTGAGGYSWWKVDNSFMKAERGLWAACVTNIFNGQDTCKDRNNVFEFDDIGRHLDITLVLLIASASFLLIAGLTSLFMFCCQRNKGAWMCSAITVAVCSFFGTAAGFGSLIYAEVKFEYVWDKKGVEHGWSVIAAWLGAAAALVAFLLALILFCVSPHEYERHHNPQAQHDPQFNPGYEQGFPMK